MEKLNDVELNAVKELARVATNFKSKLDDFPVGGLTEDKSLCECILRVVDWGAVSAIKYLNCILDAHAKAVENE